MNNITKHLSKVALELGAFQFSPKKPFQWSCGAIMPVYNDNRLLIGQSTIRSIIAQEFASRIKALNVKGDAIAGCATGGIPHATTLADLLQLPLFYIRGENKKHGSTKRIEGGKAKGKKVALIEDVLSTGNSAASAATALIDAGATVVCTMAIFSYEFKKCKKKFIDLDIPLEVIFNFQTLMKTAAEENFLNTEQIDILKQWHKDPFLWAHEGLENIDF